MLIESLGSEEYDDLFNTYSSQVSWNERRIEEACQRVELFKNFATPHSKHVYEKILPMSGEASIDISKEPGGQPTATIDITHTSEDGNISITAQGSINTDGEVSGKAKVGISWDND
ncbi:MAG: hypothetical protein COT85_04935 [Chlamydiae bacterium CG10_big_fil_rev_8_21_14_0_10_42_34]|nr:MAG: hypothetical protein COT85_04935 [Chlamydiae bacterium CG10_big_fil_rev_8_21_14_0_10_42_34]